MKPCWRNRKRLAALVLGGLRAGQALELRRHIEKCVGCRRRFEELAGIRDELAAGAPSPEGTPSAGFHPRLMRALRKQTARSVFGYWTSQLEPKRLALGFGLLLTGAVFWAVHERSSAPERKLASHRTPPALARVSQPEPPAPTMANYRAAAERSLDVLDNLVTKQALRCAPAMPLYTASSLAWLNTPKRLEGFEGALER